MTITVSTLPNGLRVITDRMEHVETASLGVWCVMLCCVLLSCVLVCLVLFIFSCLISSSLALPRLVLLLV